MGTVTEGMRRDILGRAVPFLPAEEAAGSSRWSPEKETT